jgi:cytochrome c oxidase cbb3-type subunit 3/ubiquinol-cytochrome c reductase cytochrome c subunit
MSLRALVLTWALCLGACHSAPVERAALRPDQVLDFPTLYSQNCQACHGRGGRNGAAIALANPLYIATAGVANIQRVVAAGVPGLLMPPFGAAAGGALTDAQIEAIAKGIAAAWGKAVPAATVAYAGTLTGDAARGRQTFETACVPCHGGNAMLDPDYLALISDQGLRSFVIAGHEEKQLGLNDQQVTDTVAWLASNRVARK